MDPDDSLLMDSSDLGDVNLSRKPSKRRRLSLASLPPIIRRPKRKGDQEDDNISVQSLNVSIKVDDDETPETKSRRKRILQVANFVNFLSPGRSLKDRSNNGFKVPMSPALRQSPSPYRPPLPSPAKRRLTRTWSDTMAPQGVPVTLNPHDIKLQEAIYELYQGEVDLMEDLKNVAKNYRDSMMKLNLLNASEVEAVFGHVERLIPIHQALVTSLQNLRQPDGTTHSVGKELLLWLPELTPYVEFCANQVLAKAVLEEKKKCPAVDDFLQRCQESPFSRKLDLWSLLDGARGRFVKYPLLIKSILKYTPEADEDAKNLLEAVEQVEKLIVQADTRTGEAKCKFYQDRLVYLHDDQRHPDIQASSTLVCNGCLKNNKGTRLHVFLLDKALVVTRSVTQGGQACYQLYRQPIPISQLCVEDLPDGEVKLGSFRSAFSQDKTAKNCFRVGFKTSGCGQSHTLLANDKHDKRQWINSFRQVTDDIKVVEPSQPEEK